MVRYPGPVKISYLSNWCFLDLIHVVAFVLSFFVSRSPVNKSINESLMQELRI